MTKAVAEIYSFLLLSWECDSERGLRRGKAELELPSQASGLRRGMWRPGPGRAGEHRQGRGQQGGQPGSWAGFQHLVHMGRTQLLPVPDS